MEQLALRQYRTQESARWKNRKENNLLTKEIKGKGGIEYKRNFQLRSMDKERRRIQEELETIRDHGRRKGMRRDSGTGIITTTLNPPLETLDGRDRRASGPKLTPRLQMTDSHKPFDIPPVQRPIASKEPFISRGERPRQDYVGQPVNPTPSLTDLQSDPSEQIWPIRLASTENTPTELPPKEGTGKDNPLWHPDVFHRRHMVQFVDEDHLTHKKGRGSKFGSVSFYPSNLTDPDLPKWTNREPLKADAADPDGTITITDLSIQKARENVARRLSLPVTGTLPNRTEFQGQTQTKLPSSHQQAEDQSSSEMSSKTSSTNQVAVKEAANRAANAETEEAYRDTLVAAHKGRRGSKPLSDALKNPQRFDTDMYNPDGSVRTKHMMPKFEESYKQAQNARYIRSKERSLLDKELSVKEIFDEPEREST